MKTVALVAPDSSGHHEMYLRLLMQTLVDCGHRIAVFTPHAALIQQWAESTLQTKPEQIQTIELTYRQKYHLPGVLSVWFGKTAWVRGVSSMIRLSGVTPDLVFHTWLDNCLTPGLSASLTDALFPYQWSGIYFHPWYLRRKMRYERLRHGTFANYAALMSHRCPAVAVLDEGIAEKLRGAINGKPVITFPDFTDTTAPEPDYPVAKQIITNARGRKIVSLLGVLTNRKGLLMLINIARQAADENFFFVFAGQFDRASYSIAELGIIDSFAASKPENCLFHFDRIETESRFNALVALSDVVYAAYLGFYSSSDLMTTAAVFKKPVLVSEGGLMGERVHRYGLGIAIEENNTSQCLDALRLLCNNVSGTGSLPMPRYDEYAKLHSVSQLSSAFRSLLGAAGI